MSDENQTKKEAVVEVITYAKSESSKATDSIASSLESLTNFFDDIFNKKLPKLPKGFLDFMVQYMPIFNIIGMVWKGLAILGGLLLVLATSGLAIFSFLLSDPSIGQVPLVSTIIGVVASSIALYFAIKAHPGLEPKKAFGWNNLYYGWLAAMVLGILTSLTSSFNLIVISLMLFGLIFTLLWDALILYVIFQLRSYYSNK
jgi:hypothetical protein